MGQRLLREQALEHPRAVDFYRIVDLVMLVDSEVNSYVNPAT